MLKRWHGLGKQVPQKERQNENQPPLYSATDTKRTWRRFGVTLHMWEYRGSEKNDSVYNPTRVVRIVYVSMRTLYCIFTQDPRMPYQSVPRSRRIFLLRALPRNAGWYTSHFPPCKRVSAG